ncbi:hypothetical protein EMCG_03481 [[Emmonsia] crescens]|uniref:Uncharacterized protein n=1 Tax=[Emmonsia] crescens TaxID=73230 RepID=A0A0G2J048_9EURO|nr:hypothetical protein EMCG_03481 [Emmonsia crescens UAMH 3008]
MPRGSQWAVTIANKHAGGGKTLELIRSWSMARKAGDEYTSKTLEREYNEVFKPWSPLDVRTSPTTQRPGLIDKKTLSSHVAPSENRGHCAAK